MSSTTDRFNNDLICSLREALRPEATDSDFRDVVDHLIAVMTARGLVEVEDIQNLPYEISDLDDRISALEDEDLDARLTSLANLVDDMHSEEHDLQDFEDRISSLECEDLDDRLQALEDMEIETFESRISELEMSDPAGNNAMLADRISVLEERIKLLTANNEHLSTLLRAATVPVRRWWQFWK